MAKHHDLCKKLREVKENGDGETWKKFNYQQVLKFAKGKYPKWGSDCYRVTLTMLQKLCICEEEDYSEFRDQGSKYDSLRNVKKDWVFRLGDICDEKLTDEKAAQLVKDIFDKIQDAKNTEALDNIVLKNSYLRLNKMSDKTYPPIIYTLEASEVIDLAKMGYLENNGRFVCDLSSKLSTPLEKLLYAIVWKNSDLGKERHIVAGVKAASAQTSNNELDDPDSGLVFYGFGKYLANRNNPIIDQHVIRAFLLRVAKSEEDMKKIRKMATVDKKYKVAIKNYEVWLQSDHLDGELKSIDGYKYHIDKVLFALGRAVKTT